MAPPRTQPLLGWGGCAGHARRAAERDGSRGRRDAPGEVVLLLFLGERGLRGGVAPAPMLPVHLHLGVGRHHEALLVRGVAQRNLLLVRAILHGVDLVLAELHRLEKIVAEAGVLELELLQPSELVHHGLHLEHRLLLLLVTAAAAPAPAAAAASISVALAITFVTTTHVRHAEQGKYESPDLHSAHQYHRTGNPEPETLSQ